MKKTTKICLTAAIIIYSAIMLFLLFLQRLAACGGNIASLAVPDYFSALLTRFELVPFRTVTAFIGSVSSFSLSDHAFRNLAGNIVLFIPLGLFLPALFPKQRSFRILILTTAAVISAVELLQAFTLLGTCDIDDLILNTAGAAAGYGIFLCLGKLGRD